jgi:peptidoglycan/xylan/chitin deacetylase (PgdA/CDA1 family)
MLGLAVLLLILRPAPGLPAAFVPPPILMYHRVDVDRPRDAVGRQLTVSPEQLRAQLAYLRAQGIRAISMQQMRARLAAGASLDRTVVLTFDDGYADQYTYALPLLRAYGAAATFYIVTENIDTPRHLTWSDLRAMQADGEDIGAHGLRHDDLSLMPPLEQERQVDNSIGVLRSVLHAPVTSYGYPSGRFNRQTLQIVREAGVDFAVTTDPVYVIAPRTRFELPRLRVRGDWTLAQFAQAIERAAEQKVTVRSFP